jgi:serine/threonine protein kinase
MNHPNIVKLKEVIRENDILYFIMEYMVRKSVMDNKILKLPYHAFVEYCPFFHLGVQSLPTYERQSQAFRGVRCP